MRSKLVALAVAGAAAMGGTAAFVVSAGAAPPPKVTICHGTNAAGNAYVQNTPNAVGDIQGHAKHTGPIATSQAQADQFKDDKIAWGDIIPPIPALNFPGLNFPGPNGVGAAMLANGCNFVAPPTTTSPPPTTTTPPPPPGKVTICHRDNNAKQPYGPKPITLAEQGAVNGHGDHTGPIATSVAVAEALKAQGQFWGDIIPPIPDLNFPGLNWPAGQAILAAGCQVPGPPPPTTAPPSSTRPPSSTTRPPSSTTLPPPTTKPVTPTTKAPTTTTRPAPPTTTTLPKVVPVPPGPKTPLAFTGTDSGRVALVALVMLIIGLALIARRQRPDHMLAIAVDAPVRPRPATPAITPPEARVDAEPVEHRVDSNRLWQEFHDAVGALNEWLDEKDARPERDED
jgi:hypothetical protein